VEHRFGLVTVYAHNLRNLVEQGARVRRGTVIASVGKTGRTTGPNLHFEVRRDNIARNPFHYLPRRGEPAAVMAKQEPVPFGG
jgi:murein DD-endopeptidase MepM/ murein hydrolase activator NlpD